MIDHYRVYRDTIKNELAQYVDQTREIVPDKQGLLQARRILDSEELLWQLTKRREKKTDPGTNRKRGKKREPNNEPEAGTSNQNQ